MVFRNSLEITGGVASARASPSPGVSAGRKKAGSENEAGTGGEPEKTGGLLTFVTFGNSVH